jgi:hypothetical protein
MAFNNAKERVKAQLVLDGVKVTTKPKGFPYEGPAALATVLTDAAGVRLDPDAVKTMPGFAAYIDKFGDQARPVIYCTDPARYGYTPAGQHTGRPGDQDSAEREAAKAAHAEYLAALGMAEGVRREFYRASYAPARSAKKLFVEALRATILDERALMFSGLDDVYAVLGGADDATLRTAGEDRLRRALVAAWICAHDYNLALAAADRMRDFDADAAAWWLDQLVRDGYTLSPAEAQLRASIGDQSADHPAELAAAATQDAAGDNENVDIPAEDAPPAAA